MTVIRIGHPIRDPTICFTKIDAVKELQMRGLRRNDARDSVRRVTSRDRRHEFVMTDTGDFVEVFNFTDYYRLPELYPSWKERK